MEISFCGFTILDRLMGDRSRTVEDLAEPAISVNLNAKVVLWDVVNREGKRLLHRRLDLDKPPVRRSGIVVLLQIVDQLEVVRLLDKDFSYVTYEAPVKRETLRWVCLPEFLDDCQHLLHGAWNRDRHGSTRSGDPAAPRRRIFNAMPQARRCPVPVCTLAPVFPPTEPTVA